MRLIDADALNPMRCPRSIAEMREWIDNEPTIDAVEVVRCKDCRFAEHREQAERVYCHRERLAISCPPRDNDDFCKYGERREDE